MRRFAFLPGFLFGIAVPAWAGSNAYIQHNLVADTAGVADFTDPNLVNPWGIAESAAGPFWISDNGAGLATIYSTSATATLAISSLQVSIPIGLSDSAAKVAPVTGQVSNSTTSFLVGLKPASFIFCSADGVISAWNGGSSAMAQVDNSAKGAAYFGLALGGTTGEPQLYVANFRSGTIEVYDGGFGLLSLPSGAFTDPKIPSGYAPFNIVNLNGSLYVAYAQQNAAGNFDVPRSGRGLRRYLRYERQPPEKPDLQRGVECAVGHGDRAGEFRSLRQPAAGGQFRQRPNQRL